MIKLHFEKLYSTERKKEHCQAAVPFSRGRFYDTEGFALLQGTYRRKGQFKVTSRWDDGSIRWLFIRFLADFPRNRPTDCYLVLPGEEEGQWQEQPGVKIQGRTVYTGKDLSFQLPENLTASQTGGLLEKVWFREKEVACSFPYPVLKTAEKGRSVSYTVYPGQWEVEEQGELVSVFQTTARLKPEKEVDGDSREMPRAQIRLSCFAGKPWIEMEYCLINTTSFPLEIQSLVWNIKDENKQDIPSSNVTAHSNYKLQYQWSDKGEAVEEVVTADTVMNTANEHFAEVFFGTLFCDRTVGDQGLCVTVWQAQQNFPKAVRADQKGLTISLVPDCDNKVVFLPGMARTQKMLLHFHGKEETKESLGDRSTIYQMPDKCTLDPKIYHEAQVFEDIFLPAQLRIPVYERALRDRADSHARAYGMMNWGDAPDPGYSQQRRGGDEPVWTNNEYDFPHACYLLYARTGVRRFLDYGIVAAEHWMDVDVCHYSQDPLLYEGQWEHTRRHTADGTICCSHQWVEGLLDTWHFTGNRRALDTAVGIGNNVLRLLDTPMFHNKGGINARETGWALRTLCALYKETGEEKWLEKCQWIVGHFTEWKEEYGQWLSPYMDNVAIHVVFMISIAASSLMRYDRVRPSEHVKNMVVDAVTDMVENCMLEDGTFYYKELPSLQRSGNNPLILEALTDAWKLTGDRRFLEAGKVTFEAVMGQSQLKIGGAKIHKDDYVLQHGDGTKTFAQSFLPLAVYYKAAVQEGIIE